MRYPERMRSVAACRIRLPSPRAIRKQCDRKAPCFFWHPFAEPVFPALTSGRESDSDAMWVAETSVRLAEQVPGDAGEVGAHRRHSDVRVA